MGYMRPTFAQGRTAAIAKLLELRRQAQKDKEPRMVLRIQGILMSLAGHTTGEIADHLKVHRSTVPLWIDQWNRYGKRRLTGGTSQWAADRSEPGGTGETVRHFR